MDEMEVRSSRFNVFFLALDLDNILTPVAFLLTLMHSSPRPRFVPFFRSVLCPSIIVC